MAPTVTTTNGRLQGAVENGVTVFNGIPFAAPPVGALRFSPPAPPERWDGVRDATRFGEVAPQVGMIGLFADVFEPKLPQGDDCLNLNVWTPDPGAAGLPVMVWIHGGGYGIGAGSHPLYEGWTFARDGVVCVTINYRLGALGFLDIGGPGSSNFGTLDQIAALQWVQENIAAFGGDPDRVTIAGESAGGSAVYHLLGAPAAKGLFRRAIAQSGAPEQYHRADHTRTATEKFYEKAGVPVGDVDALRQLDARRLVEVEDAMNREFVFQFGRRSGASHWFLPLVGGDVLPEAPLDAVRNGAGRDVDVMVGHTREEFRLFFGLDPTVIPEGMNVADLGFAEALFPGQGDKVIEIYERNRPTADAAEIVCALATDLIFRLPATRMAEARARHDARTFAYRFSWPSPVAEGRVGAGHAVDLPFMWDHLELPESRILTGDDAPRRLADDMHQAWVSFMTSGHPGHGGLPDWPVYDVESRPVLEFDAASTLANDPDAEERELWDGVV